MAPTRCDAEYFRHGWALIVGSTLMMEHDPIGDFYF